METASLCSNRCGHGRRARCCFSPRGGDEDRIRGLGLGADDYLVKPFLPKELLLRIGMILRRYYRQEQPLVQLAGSRIDFSRAEVVKEGRRFPLTAKEHEILQTLCRNAGRIVTIDQLCQAVWGRIPSVMRTA